MSKKKKKRMATSCAATSSAPPRPQSPHVGGVPLSSAIGELLRFVLSSHASANAPDDFPLSPSYCARLLEDDGDLCGKLTAGLLQFFEEGRLPGPPAAAGIPVAEEGAEKRDWEAVLLEKGAELKRMYNAVEFELHVQEPYFTQLKAEAKKVEGRLATGNYNLITQGSLLLFNKCLLLNVMAVRKYGSFGEMLQAEIISNVLPGILSIEEGVKVYRKFYTEEKENSYGVLAISVSKPQDQPYITMTNILVELGYDGLRSLLGMAKTVGTVPDGLPPPRSALISSYSSKNQLAYETIDSLLRECCWMNVYLTQPYGPVFEIRVREGYGARWSEDGSKFIGFLEPYSTEGFAKGWKH
ncbi:hypothetical protein U9M48_003902 [Paspalum notatum var. saurae]|uniref:ASCH domain-containing protein n=1 Tax=Paspalum notatum var. saurae TaxID=547442 RepID=A0AAQ3PNW4_PASNO